MHSAGDEYNESKNDVLGLAYLGKTAIVMRVQGWMGGVLDVKSAFGKELR